ncbi:multiple inositol polyphosphate phosphatase 1a [Chanos chanos]|uniref:Multiple inositol polyphosphate phosphatase 1 n=1 Tax=Chanos chanos TaxID=29144 RepID=A0A6J2WFB2_CHACN|nr:multiple inositol polyphosphate phosphatase 1-like [Chanos chanos]
MFRILFVVSCLVNSICLFLLSFACNVPNVPKIANYFGTKSRYEEVNPYLINDINAVNESLVKPPSPGCQAVHLSAIIRHGTRFPTTNNIRRMRKFHDLVISLAASNDSCVQQIKTWNMWYTDDMDGRLVRKGRKDLWHLAVRLTKSFPSLLTEENLREGRIKFITSSKHRCVNSTIAFKEGLADTLHTSDSNVEYIINDALMRFFDQCLRFVEKSKAAAVEVDNFKSGAHMRRVQEKIADRLQIPYGNITNDMVEAAFYLCSYEFSIKGESSPWCQLFDEVDAKTIEYAGDLKHYWKKGYGHDINSKSSCILFQDLFSRLDKAAQERRSGEQLSEVVTVQVGHAETLLPLLTLLGFFKDNEQLTATNFDKQDGRAFRTSHIMPYAANLLVTLYDCPEGFRLQFRLNEKPLTLPGIADPAPTYQAVREHYSILLSGCDQETVCKLSK